jgi:hypothetical protein
MSKALATRIFITISISRRIRVLGLATVLLIFAALGNAGADQNAANVDDGWRRTKDGWENIATWPTESVELLLANQVSRAPAIISPTAARWLQLHPAILASGMCLLAGLALIGPRPASK